MVVDKNNNDRLDKEELEDIIEALQPREPCIEGFIKSCDSDGDDTIEFREWVGCFPEGGRRRIVSRSFEQQCSRGE